MALRLLRPLLADFNDVLGPNHPNTLYTHSAIGVYTAHAGRPREGVAILREVIPRLERFAGPQHPYTIDAMRALCSIGARDGLVASRFTSVLYVGAAFTSASHLPPAAAAAAPPRSRSGTSGSPP
jgi:hypothetical protein